MYLVIMTFENLVHHSSKINLKKLQKNGKFILQLNLISTGCYLKKLRNLCGRNGCLGILIIHDPILKE